MTAWKSTAKQNSIYSFLSIWMLLCLKVTRKSEIFFLWLEKLVLWPLNVCVFQWLFQKIKSTLKKKKRKVKLCLKRCNQYLQIENDKCSCPVVFYKKGVLKIFGKFTGKQPWGEGGGCYFSKIALGHECFPVNFPKIFRTALL